MSPKARPSAARKQTEPVPVGAYEVLAASVTAAEGRANNRSRSGWTGLDRPSSASRNPTLLPADLLRNLGQLRQPLLQRGMGGEQGGDCALGERGRRSEEHTSELQSRRDLVCRLLLEKKKN